MNSEEKPPKVHLYQDNTDKVFANGALGLMANTYCQGNYHNYETTTDIEKVNCKNCLDKIKKVVFRCE